jgi:hypothetical protein
MARRMLSNEEKRQSGSIFTSNNWELRKIARAIKHLKRNKPKNI